MDRVIYRGAVFQHFGILFYGNSNQKVDTRQDHILQNKDHDQLINVCWLYKTADQPRLKEQPEVGIYERKIFEKKLKTTLSTKNKSKIQVKRKNTFDQDKSKIQEGK